ncbi:MAG: hypothetical protein V1867_05030 [Candidatus Falkowbacteria bacterium]
MLDRFKNINLAKEKIEKAREKIIGPRRIEFVNGKSLVVSVTGDEPEIKLMEGDREVLDLKTLAPEGTKLEFSEKNKWGAIEGKICIGKFTGIDCLLAYLHEAGHLHNGDMKMVRAAEAGYLLEKIKDKQWRYPTERLRALKEEKTVVMASERNAWAYALRQARKLEKGEGIDIFERFGGVKGVFSFVNKYLESYEERYMNELYHCDIFTKEDMEELFARLDEAEEKEAA